MTSEMFIITDQNCPMWWKTRFVIRHWFFKPLAQHAVRNPEIYRTNQWLLDNFHRLYWCKLETLYEDLQSLLSINIWAYKFNFREGLQKKQFLLKHIIHNIYMNLERLAYSCLKLKDLSYVHRMTYLRHWFAYRLHKSQSSCSKVVDIKQFPNNLLTFNVVMFYFKIWLLQSYNNY